MHHLRAAGAGRLGDDLQDERHERTRVVRRRQRVTDERDRLARVAGRRVSLAALVTEASVRRRARLLSSRSAENRDQQR